MNKPQVAPTKKVRNIQQLGWTAEGTKGLEAVVETKGTTANYYYQVVHVGKEVLQTVSLKEAQEKFDSLK
jgi:hypothetical protein